MTEWEQAMSESSFRAKVMDSALEGREEAAVAPSSERLRCQDVME